MQKVHDVITWEEVKDGMGRQTGERGKKKDEKDRRRKDANKLQKKRIARRIKFVGGRYCCVSCSYFSSSSFLFFFFLPLFSVNIAFLSSTFRSTFPAKTFAQYIHAKRRVIRQCDDDQERLLSDTKRNVMFHAIPPYNFMMASMRDVGSHRNTKNRSHNGRLKSTLAFLQRSIYRE